MNKESQIIENVSDIYQWLEDELAGLGQSCDACGKCCDFESFGHRLYVTTPELIYLRHFVGQGIKEMTDGVCPYRVNGQCTVYDWRFSGCRIFTCKGDAEKENAICEQAISKFRVLCDESDIPYHYVYLKDGLQMMSEHTD